MKITLLCRLRNESILLPDFLEHVDPFINEAFWFDDCSNDNTVEILKSYPKTVEVLRNYFHNPDQSFVQTSQRKLLLDYAKQVSKNNWFILIEPDERIEFDFSKIEEYDKQEIKMIYFRLFDTYMTKEDKNQYAGEKLWNFRKYFGPEYRNIGFLFNKEFANYDIGIPNCRQPYFSGKSIIDGLVQHYGKALSEDHWAQKCEYYMTHVPALAQKWQARKGKAIHIESDFGRPLMTWNQIKDKRNFKKLIQI